MMKNKQKYIVLMLACMGILSIVSISCQKKQKEAVDYVNPLIGTGGHGHTFPGATMPFGMVQLSPDTRLTGWDGCSAYHNSDDTIYGFSHTHLSGTGCSDYGDILIMPGNGEILWNNGADGKEGYCSGFNHINEKAEAGYYSVMLDKHTIKAELTASERVGFHKYSFDNTEETHFIIDFNHRDKLLAGSIEKVNDTLLIGSRLSSAWTENQYLFFAISLSSPITEMDILLNDTLLPASQTSAEGEKLKAAVHFDPDKKKEIILKVALSAVSEEGAIKNLQAEAPVWDFEAVHNNARNKWNDVLSKISVEGGTEEQKEMFYTALYHSYIAPNLFTDVDGQYRGTDLKIHQPQDHTRYTVFSLWDTFRATHPLYTIMQQERTLDFIKSFLGMYKESGRLPVWELAATDTRCMIGYHSVPVIVDAYMKGIQDFDHDLAMEAMIHSSMTERGIESYLENGFIDAQDEGESVSKTLEYAYDDWCIAQFAKSIGDTAIYKTYTERAQYYKNLYDPQTGFFRARMQGHWFAPFDPAEVNFNYTEANAWQYSLFVPQDIESLIQIMGGEEKFEEHLDKLFSVNSETSGREQADITGMIGQYAHGNEPSHHMAYLYNYIGKPAKSQEVVQRIMKDLYTTQPDGLSGNEDCGQMSSWYVLSAMGFYPVCPGSDQYVLGSPVFNNIKLELENGNIFTITAENISDKNIYIKEAYINEEKINRSYILHSEIMKGGQLKLVMSETPSEEFGKKYEDRPHSKISNHQIVPTPFFIAENKTFDKEIEYSIACIDTEAQIHFLLNTAIYNPSLENPYNAPIRSTETHLVAAYATKDGKSSKLAKTMFSKIREGLSIEIKTPYANQYAAGGDHALIDGSRGPENYRTGLWQGYRGDMELIIDQSKVKMINVITIGFLQDIKSWIWYPSVVEIELSTDGINYLPAGTMVHDFPRDKYGAYTMDMTVKPERKARYIKLKTKGIGEIPAWHDGSGEKPWIFADEILIQ